jgi:hypothetical protein
LGEVNRAQPVTIRDGRIKWLVVQFRSAITEFILTVKYEGDYVLLPRL